MKLVKIIETIMLLARSCFDGRTLRGKVSLSRFHGIWLMNHTLYRLFNDGSKTESTLSPRLTRDVYVEMPRGNFNCRRGTTDPAIINRYNERNVLTYLGANVRSGIFVDVGAHIGLFSIYMGLRLATSGKVVAIEPEPGNFSNLLRNISHNNLSNVETLEGCAWSSQATLNLMAISPGSDRVGDEGSYFLQEITDIQGITNQEAVRSTSVSGYTLDALLRDRIQEVRGIKIDAEGATLEVLKGGEEILRATKYLHLVFESSNKEIPKIVNFLKSLGFQTSQLSKSMWASNRIDVGQTNL